MDPDMDPEPEPSVTAWVSGSDIAHLDPDGCDGLDKMREHGRDPRLVFRPTVVARNSDLAELARTGVRFSLCRLCAVDPVLRDVFTAHLSPHGPRVFATFTHERPPVHRTPRYPPFTAAAMPVKRRIAVKAPAPERGPEEQDRLRRLRDSADRAMRHVAETAGLDVTDTPAGLAVYGFVPHALTGPLSGVVRTEIRATVTTQPTRETVNTFWSLLKNATPPPEDAPPEMDPWYVAELIQSPPA